MTQPPANPASPDPEHSFQPRPPATLPGRRARRDERDGYAAADQLQAQRPQWMILYGCYSRRFWAWPKFPVTGRVIINAPYPDILIPRLDQAEQTYRLRRSDHPPEPGPSGPESPP